jgi:Tol biopolymer transport system component
MAVHRSGRCLKTLTELPGDELQPVFSPDGQTLAFAVKQGDSHVVAKIPFLSSGATVTCN